MCLCKPNSVGKTSGKAMTFSFTTFGRFMYKNLIRDPFCMASYLFIIPDSLRALLYTSEPRTWIGEPFLYTVFLSLQLVMLVTLRGKATCSGGNDRNSDLNSLIKA